MTQQLVHHHPAPPGSSDGSPSEEGSTSSDPERPAQFRQHNGGEPPPPNEPPPPVRPPTPPVYEQPDSDQTEIEQQVANTIELVTNQPFAERTKLLTIQTNKKFKQLVEKVNIGLNKITPAHSSLREINNNIYGAALYMQKQILPHIKPPSNNQKRHKGPKIPAWKTKLTKELNTLRKEKSQITEFLINPQQRGRLYQKVTAIEHKYGINDDQHLRYKLNEITDKIPALAKQVKNKQIKLDAKNHNREFRTNARKFYHNIVSENIEVKQPPDQQELENFWRPLYENAVEHNPNNRGIHITTEKNENKQQMTQLIVIEESLCEKIKTAPTSKHQELTKYPISG